MPRGDGRKAEESRPNKKRLSLPQYIPPGLQSRILWWETELKSAYRKNDKTDGQGNSFRRPGSQKK